VLSTRAGLRRCRQSQTGPRAPFRRFHERLPVPPSQDSKLKDIAYPTERSNPAAHRTEGFNDAEAAVNRLDDIYERNTRFLRVVLRRMANGEP